MPSKYYRPELDAVRFLAFLLVYFHHTLLTQPAALVRFFGFGMQLFFVLSAFLIGELLLQEKDRFSDVNLRKFYIRRGLRIWPLYFFALFIGYLVAAFIDHSQVEIKSVGLYAVMLGNVAMVKWGGAGVMFPLWSISVEEQFYIFSPLAIRNLSQRGLWIISGLLIVVSDALLFCNRHDPKWVVHDAWFSSLVEFQMFGVGLILCLCLHGKTASRKTWYILPSLALWGFAAFEIYRSSAVAYTCVALGCVGLIRGVMGLTFPRWMIRLGKISYGLYVYHVLCFRLVNHFTHSEGPQIIVALGLTILCASVSYRYLEMPFLQMKRKYELIKTGV